MTKMFASFESFINIITGSTFCGKHYLTTTTRHARYIIFLNSMLVILLASCIDLAVDNTDSLKDNSLEHKGEYIVENRETNMVTGLIPIFDRNIPEILETATIGLG